MHSVDAAYSYACVGVLWSVSVRVSALVAPSALQKRLKRSRIRDAVCGADSPGHREPLS